MAAARWDAYGMRAVLTVYAAGVICWLALGLLPSLLAVGAVHDALVWLALGNGPLAGMAGQALDLQVMSSMADVPVETLLLEYLFSLLNLVLGLILLVRRPDDLVPRLLAVALLGTAATFNLPSHRAFYLIGTPWPVQLFHFCVHIASGVAYIWAVVLFPDGTWPRQIRLGRRTTRLVAVAVTAVAALISWRGSFLAHPQFFMVFFGVAVPILGVGAQLLRLRDRRTSAEQKAVSRLLCAALLPSLVVALLWLGGRGLGALGVDGALVFCAQLQQLFPVVFAVVPVVLVAGVLRYRLWDIDRLLSRVLVYGTLALVVGACYVVAVSAASWLGGDRLWSVVIAMAVAATLIEPLRVVARRWANRVVFGQELSPSDAMRTLVSGLEQLNAGREIDQVAEVALTATRAESAGVWLIEDEGPVRVAQAGVDRGTGYPAGDSAWQIRHEGETLGVLTLGVADGERLSARDRETAERIATHAGLVLHNARLTIRLVDRVSELATRAEALRRARRRLVAAQDEERHRLERDLHDGAQQALVAVIIGAAALRPPVEQSARDDLLEVLEIARRDLDEVLYTSRPAALARGLTEAIIEASRLAERSGVAVEVRQRGTAVLDPEVEVAIYYCCLEALQNVVKHAGAAHAWIDVQLESGVSFSRP